MGATWGRLSATALQRDAPDRSTTSGSQPAASPTRRRPAIASWPRPVADPGPPAGAEPVHPESGRWPPVETRSRWRRRPRPAHCPAAVAAGTPLGGQRSHGTGQRGPGPTRKRRESSPVRSAGSTRPSGWSAVGLPVSCRPPYHAPSGNACRIRPSRNPSATPAARTGAGGHGAGRSVPALARPTERCRRCRSPRDR